MLASSCSLVYDLSPDQCGKNTDCAKFGSAFTCDEGVCVDHSPASGGSGTSGGRNSGGSAGSGNRGGTGNGGTDNTGDTGGTGNNSGTGSEKGGSTSSGGSSMEGGAAPMGGEGGMVNPPECSTHNDCFVKNGDAKAWGCIEGQCKELKTDECPVLLPLQDANYDALKSTDAVIVGAFAKIEQSVSVAGVQNYDVALSGIADKGGIPASGGTHRQVVMVVCKSAYETKLDLLKPVDHLISDLKVPAILAALDPADQQYVFEERAHANDVFMLVPNESDDTVVNLQDDGLVYHMLAGPDSLSVTYQPLIDMTITHLQHLGRLGAGPDYDKVRISLVTLDDNRFLNDLGRDFENKVEWNGKPAVDNRPDNFMSVAVKAGTTDNNYAQVATAVLAAAPHIIVGATDDEMTTNVIQLIEAQWEDDTQRKAQGHPFYILSPLNYQGLRYNLLGGTGYPDVRTRLLGINWPATLGTSAYNAYKSAYLTDYPSGKNFDQENFYDAVYFLTYGIVAGGTQIHGGSIANGMLRITAPTGTAYDVGSDKVSEALTFLASSVKNKINLTGANGRPNWNAGGGRDTPASVWCINNAATFDYVPDVLTYDQNSGMLTGTVPANCFTFPAP